METTSKKPTKAQPKGTNNTNTASGSPKLSVADKRAGMKKQYSQLLEKKLGKHIAEPVSQIEVEMAKLHHMLKAHFWGADPSAIVAEQEKNGVEFPVPLLFVRFMVELIDRDGHLEEGIFRLSPEMAELAQLQEVLEHCQAENFDFGQVADPLIFSSLIKGYLKSWPDVKPLLNNVAKGKIFGSDTRPLEVDPETKLFKFDQMEDLLLSNDISEVGLNVLFVLKDFLNQWVIPNAGTTKMHASNLAICLAPNIYIDNYKGQDAFTAPGKFNLFMQTFLHPDCCPVPEELSFARLLGRLNDMGLGLKAKKGGQDLLRASSKELKSSLDKLSKLATSRSSLSASDGPAIKVSGGRGGTALRGSGGQGATGRGSSESLSSSGPKAGRGTETTDLSGSGSGRGAATAGTARGAATAGTARGAATTGTARGKPPVARGGKEVAPKANTIVKK